MSPKRILPVRTHALPTRENKKKKKKEIESDACGHAAADAPCSNTLLSELCVFFGLIIWRKVVGFLIEVRKKEIYHG